MSSGQPVSPQSMNADLIAPCGMNCGLCIGHLRERRQCPGCHGEDRHKPKHCVVCRIKTCSEMTPSTQSFCHVCNSFPCTRLRQLDKRYRTKYGMSMIENLENIRDMGIDEFVTRETARWACPSCGAILCVHRTDCMHCGAVRS